MTLSVEAACDAIASASADIARRADGNLASPVEHCPGWAVSDLLGHLIEVHWFWATVVEYRLLERPESGPPAIFESDELIERFLAGSRHLVDVLRAADQSERVYTWAPQQHDVAFVTRHQVQEIEVHGWDVAHAVGERMTIDPEIATDSIEEFLTFSVSSDADPAEPLRPALNGALGLRCEDADEAWTVCDSSAPGTVRFEPELASDVPVVSGTSSDILLWLYSRVELPGEASAFELGRRLRALSYTD